MTPFCFGPGKCMREFESLAAALAASDLPILLEGESGTGKETLARHIHCLHGGSGKFLRLYCGFDSGGRQNEWLEQARGAGTRTLFLKHFHLLPPALQSGLLEAFDAPERDPLWKNSGSLPVALGSSSSSCLEPPATGLALSGTRLIASSNGSLERRVARGEFSVDLYSRLSVCRLALPPLRERAADIPALFLSFLGGRELDPRLEKALLAYPWPGNVRELESVAKSYAMAPDPERLIEELARRSESLPESDLPGEAPSLKEQVRRAARRVESGIILRTLEQHQWNRRRAARTLKISYRALLYKMKAFQLRGDAWEGAE
jgi:two-component system, NtrC family, response regulator AtoC